MSDLTSYEEELSKRLKELSSPNKALVWDKIEKLLDEEDDKGSIILLPDRIKIIWGLLLLLLFAGALWLFISSDKHQQITTENHVINKIKKDNPTTFNANNSKIDDSAQPEESVYKKNEPANNRKNNFTLLHSSKVLTEDHKRLLGFLKHHAFASASNKPINKNGLLNEISSGENKNLIINREAKTKFNNSNAESNQENQPGLKEEQILVDSNNDSSPQNEKYAAEPYPATAKRDSNVIKAFSNTAKADSSAINKKKVDTKKTKFYIAAGVSLQQLIRLHNDLVYPSDNYTSSLTDYLPSIYLRLYNTKSWFIQSEFKYAAPQDINEFIYRVNVQNQPFKDILTSYTLKKIYYHQVYASFHYFILPNWSIGSGIIYNIFSGADIEKDLHQKQYESANDLFLGSTGLTDKDDSSFSSHVRNDFQLLLETQYKWKHFSIGLRYAAGLQPYIKYIDPISGSPAEKNINSLNAFIRYELWKSKKK